MVEITPVQLSVPSSEKKEDKEWFESFIDQAKKYTKKNTKSKRFL